MENNDHDFSDALEDLRLESVRICSLINLCEAQGILPGLTVGDVGVYLDACTRDPNTMAIVSLQSRFRKMHTHLHELLYAPKS